MGFSVATFHFFQQLLTEPWPSLCGGWMQLWTRPTWVLAFVDLFAALTSTAETGS